MKRKLIRLESPVATRNFADSNKKTATPILQMGIRGSEFCRPNFADHNFADAILQMEILQTEFCRWEFCRWDFLPSTLHHSNASPRYHFSVLKDVRIV